MTNNQDLENKFIGTLIGKIVFIKLQNGFAKKNFIFTKVVVQVIALVVNLSSALISVFTKPLKPLEIKKNLM